MNAVSLPRLVAAIVDAGGVLMVDGDRLLYRLPPELNTPATLAALRDYKAAILAALMDPHMQPAGGYPTPGRYLTPADCIAPRACCRLGPCIRNRTGEPCHLTTPGTRATAA